MFLVEFSGTPLALLAPVPLKIVVDNALGGKPLPHGLALFLGSRANLPTALVLVASVLLVVVALMGLTQRFAGSWLNTFVGERLTLEFRTRLFGHVQRLSLAYHDSRGTSDTTYRIQYDAPAIQWVMVDALVPLAGA